MIAQQRGCLVYFFGVGGIRGPSGCLTGCWTTRPSLWVVEAQQPRLSRMCRDSKHWNIEKSLLVVTYIIYDTEEAKIQVLCLNFRRKQHLGTKDLLARFWRKSGTEHVVCEMSRLFLSAREAQLHQARCSSEPNKWPPASKSQRAAGASGEHISNHVHRPSLRCVTPRCFSGNRPVPLRYDGCEVKACLTSFLPSRLSFARDAYDRPFRGGCNNAALAPCETRHTNRNRVSKFASLPK